MYRARGVVVMCRAGGRGRGGAAGGYCARRTPNLAIECRGRPGREWTANGPANDVCIRQLGGGAVSAAPRLGQAPWNGNGWQATITGALATRAYCPPYACPTPLIVGRHTLIVRLPWP